MDLYNDEIEVSSYDSNANGYRHDRLQRVIGYLCALAEHYGNDYLLAKISKLHDHKGTLMITWKSAPTPGEKEFAKKAWLSAIGDGADNVKHEVVEP